MARRMALSTLGALAVLLVAQGGSAQTRVVVADFGGAGSGAIRNHVVRGLSGESGIELVSSDDFEGAGGLDDLATAAADLGVAAVVQGTVARRGRRWLARITVRDSSGDEIGEHDFVSRNLRGLGSAVRRGVGRRLGDVIRDAEPPSGTGGSASVPPARSGGPIRVVVRSFDGPGAGRARAIVVEELADQGNVELVESDDADEVADDLGADLGTPDGRVAVARELRINAWVDGEVARRGRRVHMATVRVSNGLDGFLLEEASFRGRNAGQLASSLRGGVWSRLGASLQVSRPPPAPAGEGGDDMDYDDEDDVEDDGDDVADAGPSGPRPPAIRLGASFRILRRDLSYEDDLFGQLRPYGLAGWPALGLEAQWYPGAHFTDGLAANIGLEFRGEVGIAMQSEDSSGVEYPTDSSSWSLGLRARLALADGMELGPVLSYGRHAYAIEAANEENPKPDVPDVDYEHLRIGTDFAWELIDGISVRARFAWLQVLSAGEIQSDVWFPRLDVAGVEAMAGVGYALTDELEVRAEVDLRRYFYTMNPEPGDPWIAGGAADQYLVGSLGITWVP